MPVQYDTVAIPVTKGVDVNTRARLIQAPGLLEAQNSRFTRGAGAEKRAGHVGERVRGQDILPVATTLPRFQAPSPWEPYYTGVKGLPDNWLLGWGPVVAPLNHNAAARYVTSTHPDAGLLFGSFARDDEFVAWNGHQLFSRAPAPEGTDVAPSRMGSAVMPHLKALPVAKAPQAQDAPDLADNGNLRVACWLQGTAAAYTVANAKTGAALVPPTQLTPTATSVRVMEVGGWFHLAYYDTGTGKLTVTSLHEASPSVTTTRSQGDCNGYWDFHKFSEVEWLLARNIGGTSIVMLWLKKDGTTSGRAAPTPITDPTIHTLAITAHPKTHGIALVYRRVTAGPVKKVVAKLFSGNASLVTTVDLGFYLVDARPVAVAPKYLQSLGELWDVYWDDYLGVADADSPPEYRTYWARVGNGFTGSVMATSSRAGLLLASHAFRVGDRTFIWAGSPSALQATWVLLDEGLLPVGHAHYGVANVRPYTAFPTLASVNWSGPESAQHRTVFQGALGYRVRVPSDSPSVRGLNDVPVYAEPSVAQVTLDFLPPLRAAQANRSTYLPGAQLWSYDGSQLVEAGFHLAPEAKALGTATAGSLTGTYIYRVDYCYRNAQNEEIRSQSFYTTAVTVAGKTIRLRMTTAQTRRTGAYLLIFRNESNGTAWYLVNSRDPQNAAFVPSNSTTPWVEWIDTGLTTDAALIAKENYPGQVFSYIPPVSAPACEVIAGGVDRLWVSGGELSPGSVLPSRLFGDIDTPAFNPVMVQPVDRGSAPITAIGFVGDAIAVFRRDSIYILEGDGPDNLGSGVFSPPRLAYSDTGAVGPEGLALIGPGLLFQSPAGFQLLSPGGGLQNVGMPVAPLARTLPVASAVVVGPDHEVRFYGKNGLTLVYNYQHDAWSTWTLSAWGASRVPGGTITLAHPEGSFWVESPGHYLDDDRTYTHRIRFSWLRAGDLDDFQRVRRVGAIGEGSPDHPHTVHVEVFYDEREFAEERFDVAYAQDTWNTDSFGANTFGAGAFGDTEASDYTDSASVVTGLPSPLPLVL